VPLAKQVDPLNEYFFGGVVLSLISVAIPSPNDQAKLPGPPAKPLKREKP